MSDNESRGLLKGRATAQVLVVAHNTTTSNQIRSAVKTLGFSRISTCASHVAGIDRARGRSYQLVIFETQDADMPNDEFVAQFLKLDSSATLLAVSTNPRIDDVFSLLKNGARGFLVPPFSLDVMEDVLVHADDGPLFSEEVLNAPDRNAALVGVILNNLYKAAVSMRQAREFASAVQDSQRYRAAFAESVELALLFCEGDNNDMLIDRIVESCMARAKGPASRLGRMRQRLRRERDQSDDDVSFVES